MTTQHLLGFFTIFLFAARPFPALYLRGQARAALTIEPLLGGEEDGEHDAAGHLPVLLGPVQHGPSGPAREASH